MEQHTQRTFLNWQLPHLLLTIVLLAPWTWYALKQPKGALAANGGNIELQVTTFNTEYWHSSESELVDAVHYREMDLVLLQEHLELRGEDFFPTNRIPQLQSVLADRFVDHHGEVVTISKWPIVASKHFANGEGLRSDVQLANGSLVSVYNIHLPVHLHFKLLRRPWEFFQDAGVVAQRRENLLREVSTDIAANPHPIIVGGDFNTSLAMNGTRWFRAHLIDTYSAPHCDGRRNTWQLTPLLGWRIDYLFVSSHFRPGSYCIKPLQTISDHDAIVATLGSDAVERLGALP